MAGAQGPNLGAYFGFVDGESGWTAQYEYNWRLLDAVTQLAVTNRTLTVAPGAPANGDRYIVAASATGVWVGQAGKIAVYRASGYSGAPGWEFYPPKEGWSCVILAESKRSTYISGAWNTGVAI